MRCLIRFLTSNAAGDVEHSDKIVDAPVITIGRATDQILHLKDRRARLEHAQIAPKNGAIHISTGAMAGVTVNGRSQRDAKLSVGDVIEVGSNILRVIEAPEGADFAFTFELSTTAASEHLEQSWTTPTSGIGGFSKRKLSWSFAAIVLVAAFVIPLLLLDGWLTAGPVHSAHSSIAGDCDSCHVNAFERVPDSACLDCHTPELHVDATPHAVLGEVRCASCHLEHNTPEQLVKRHQGLCADCHTALPDDVPLQSASDFLDAHPDFRVSLLRPERLDTGELEWNINHVDLAAAMTADRSNLRFDHKVHLAADGIITPDGRRVIDCGECHVPEPGGARMQAISMDKHCSGCHTLTFDPDDPARTVPHGNARAVVQSLVEYYSARLLGEDPDAVEQRIRRPGQSLTRADRDRAAAEARERALSVAADLFERQACANCHEVTRLGDNAEFPWAVLPVRLTDTFFPHANFAHDAHDTEVTSCDSCHNASASESAHDLLMPDIGSCRECHGSGIARRNSASQIPSTCIMCHSFHFEAKGEYTGQAP